MPATVLVVGGGPAGASAAIFLASRGLDVVVVDRAARPTPGSGRRMKIGESLPPDAGSLIDQLGVRERFEAGTHLPCYGNKSYWGGDEARHHDFVSHPRGDHGWHIDRVEFEHMLVERAIEVGVAFHGGTTVTGACRSGDRWDVALACVDGRSIEARYDFVVDATGRAAWFARRQGVDRLVEDDPLALVAFLGTAEVVEDTTTLVESTDAGWWYSAAIPGQRMATAFFCKPDEHERAAWLQEDGWWALLSRAPHTERRIADGRGGILAPPRFVSAQSAILERLHGDGWLAVGDAAMTYDPIASHGLMLAMVGARDAARAIHRALAGEGHALAAYDALMWAAFQQYGRQRLRLYAQLQVGARGGHHRTAVDPGVRGAGGRSPRLS